jgi:hypothetical protein
MVKLFRVSGWFLVGETQSIMICLKKHVQFAQETRVVGEVGLGTLLTIPQVINPPQLEGMTLLHYIYLLMRSYEQT